MQAAAALAYLEEESTTFASLKCYCAINKTLHPLVINHERAHKQGICGIRNRRHCTSHTLSSVLTRLPSMWPQWLSWGLAHLLTVHFVAMMFCQNMQCKPGRHCV